MNLVFGQSIYDDMDLMYAMFSGIKVKTGPGKYMLLKSEVIRNELANTMGWKIDMDMDDERNKEINKYYHPSNLHESAKIFNAIIRDRNNLIINSRNKIEMVMQIIRASP